jgi:Cu+-exporting ATPase
MSVMVGIGRGARAGILIRSAEALERLAKVDTVVVDKTGTLTEGHPSLTTCIALAPLSENELLRIAGSIEQNSEHPLAAAIVKEAKNRGLRFPPTEAFQAFPGLGVSARVQGHQILMGNRAMLDQNRIADANFLHELSHRLERDGHTTIHVAMDGKLAGLLAVSDPVKASTPEAVDQLKRHGIRLVLVTGDQPQTAEAIARRLGIEEVYSKALPAEKARRIAELRASGRCVVMAGDGINDAPALATADVGMAMGTGIDVAIESADVTLVKGDLRGIEKAIRLSRAVMRNIRQNLLFAFLYNSAGVPVAAGILYPLFGFLLNPILAGAAMSLSSVSVIANALRLKKLKF